MKRGLVGSLTRWLLPGEIVTTETLVALSLVATAALLSSGVGQLLADLGRFDILNYTLCLIAVLVARLRRAKPVLGFRLTTVRAQSPMSA